MKMKIYGTQINLINPWIYEIHEIWGFTQGFTRKSEDLSLKHEDFMMRQMNRQKIKKLDLICHERSSFHKDPSANLSMSVGQTDCVKGNLCPNCHTDIQTKEDEHPQICSRI